MKQEKQANNSLMPVKVTFRYLPLLLHVLYILFLASIICSWNFISSVTIGLIFILGIIKNKVEKGALLENQFLNIFLIGCIFLYILQLVALLYTKDFYEGLRHVQLKTSIAILPMALYQGNFLDNSVRQKVMRAFVAVLFFVTVYCLLVALVTYLKTNESAVFFYHRLVSSLEQHAIQFLILVFIALVHLLEEARRGAYYVSPNLHLGASLYFTVFLIILSSKLIIAFFGIYLVYYIIRNLKKANRNRYAIPIFVLGSVIIGALLLFTRNPVTNRFTEIIAGKIEIINADKFTPGMYFNGLQFRLLQWRFVREILNENHAWLTGVSPGDAQRLLDQKYISTNMYIGESARGDRGFLGYNAHNQFLESLLQTGVAGLVAFAILCAGLIQMAADVRKTELSAVVAILLAYALNESVFETQYGAMIFLFFPVFFYLTYKRSRSTQVIGEHQQDAKFFPKD